MAKFPADAKVPDIPKKGAAEILSVVARDEIANRLSRWMRAFLLCFADDADEISCSGPGLPGPKNAG
jgi:hypothetical protein